MTELIDIGANLTHDSFDHDFDDVLERAAEVGVTRMMVTGASKEGSEQARDIAERHEFLFATAGIHPIMLKRPTNPRSLFCEILQPKTKLKRSVRPGSISSVTFHRDRNRSNRSSSPKQNISGAFCASHWPSITSFSDPKLPCNSSCPIGRGARAAATNAMAEVRGP